MLADGGFHPAWPQPVLEAIFSVSVFEFASIWTQLPRQKSDGGGSSARGSNGTPRKEAVLGMWIKTKDLRESNITLYFHLKETREQLHGVTAIYLVQPTLDNIQMMGQDFEEDLYSSVIIHFSSEPQPQPWL